MPDNDDNIQAPEAQQKPRKQKFHLIRPAWLRIPLKVILWLALIVVLIPVLIYFPPVQDLLTDVACDVLHDKTGMRASVGKFRLRFPLDVQLDDVLLIEASGDTMAAAGTAIADVKVRPLFDMDVRLNSLKLLRGKYRMVAADSSMVMKLRAGLLDVDGRSSFDLKRMDLNLNQALLKDADVRMYMNVWKKKANPDTTRTKFCIRAGDLQLRNVSFAMSMLPTIDTLSFNTASLELKDGLIDLTNSHIKAGFLGAEEGSFTYITPTAKYIKEHAAPVDTVSPPSPPMVIEADSISLDKFDVIYGIRGARPQPGFDASWVSLTGLSVSLRDFYNSGSTINAPITRLMARERCGLQLLSGSGTFSLDSIGISLRDLAVSTPHTRLRTTASIPFALMEMKPDAPMNVRAEGTVGLRDLTLFMPSLSTYTNMLRPATTLALSLDAAGTLSAIKLRNLNASLPGILTLRASGNVNNPLKPNIMRGNVDFRASLTSPAFAQRLANLKDINIPRFDITGRASIEGQTYAADFNMRTSAGNLAASGRVNLSAERYTADVTASGLNVGHIMPSLGVGVVTARVQAEGAGFNPERKGAATDIHLDVTRADYGGHSYSGIRGLVSLHDGLYDVDLASSDPDAALTVKGTGNIAPDLYTVDLTTDISNLDLRALNLSKETCKGHGYIYVKGTASPARWLYDMTLSVDNFEWELGEDQVISIPDGVAAELVADAASTYAHLDTQGVSLDFNGDAGLQSLMSRASRLSSILAAQLKEKNLDIDAIGKELPEFSLNLRADGRGFISDFLSPMGYTIGDISADIENRDSLLTGNVNLLSLNTGSLLLDTLALDLKQRGSLLDYKLHLGNTPQNLPEFADVQMNGYLGGNRASAFLTQRNDKGQTGYRVGFTAALMDSTVTVHFTPLKATIAYMPWTFNLENHVDYNLYDRTVDANLRAMSAQSSILLETHPDAGGLNSLHLNLNNIQIQDFLAMSVTAPPVQATLNSDLSLTYKGTALEGGGTLNVTDLVYDDTRVGDFDFDFNANLDFKGDTEAELALKIDDKKVMALHGLISNDTEKALDPNDFTLSLTHFPLSVANAFLGKDVAQLSGYLDGDMTMDGKFSEPKLNGHLQFADAAVTIAMMKSALHIGSEPVTVRDNLVTFNNFAVTGQNANPLTLNGTVDATKFSDILLDLALTGQNVQLMKTDSRTRADLTGKLFVNADATVKGSLSVLDINGNLSVLGTSDVAYTVSSAAAAVSQAQQSDVVKFVNFNDTTQVEQADSVARGMAMRIRAGLTVSPGTRVTVNLPAALTGGSGGNNRVFLQPSGTLNFYQNFMGDMTLNGQLMLGEGFARYSLPVVGEKNFTFRQGSFVQWNGDILNPTLSVAAYDDMKVNVSDGGNSRLVNFLVTVDITNNLKAPKVLFDLDAEGDMTIENELQSMTPEQRSTQAMNLLLYGQYTGPNTRTQQGNFAENALYSFLTSTLNSWAANNIRGVDLSFGVNQYEQTVGGQDSQTTSYSYQVSKSLFDNRFKIVVGGNYTTDASADENFAENLISDVSFEYMLKQTNSMSMLVKLFRHSDFDNILEGEVSETGVGFVMKRRMENLSRFFRVRWGKRKPRKEEAKTDSVTTPADEHSDDTIAPQPYEF